MNKHILICGGAGFIGSNFIRHLYHAYPDYRVTNLDALTYCGNRENLTDIEAFEDAVPETSRRYLFVQGDICDRDLVDALLGKERFDAVVNFAAESHVDRSLVASYDFIRTNVLGVHNLIDTCRRHGIPRFLQISTDEVYGDIREGFSHELSPLHASSPYAASKASADVLIKSYIRSHRLPAVIIRGSNNFGPYQYPEKLIPLAISNFIEGKKIPVHGTGEHTRSWLHVLDFCRAIDLVLHQGKVGEVYNAAGVHKTNMEVLEAIRSALNLPEPLSAYITHTGDRPGADLRYAPDAAKIGAELGWKAERHFDDVIGDIVSWYLANRPWWDAIKQKDAFQDHYKRQEEAKYY
jgi:dTDP-glucose 4,6-dehydratase